MKFRNLTTSLVLLAVCAAGARADIRPPAVGMGRDVVRMPVQIVVTERGMPTQVEIPLGALDAPVRGGTGAPKPGGAVPPRSGAEGRTVVAGVALALGLMVGGLCLARRQGKTLLGVVGVVAGMGGVAGAVWANAAPPVFPRIPAQHPVKGVFQVEGEVRIVNGTAVRLYIPQERLPELMRQVPGGSGVGAPPPASGSKPPTSGSKPPTSGSQPPVRP